MTKRTFSKFRSRWWAFCEIERQLKRHLKCSAQSLSKDLEVDPRTIRRYVEFMRDDLGAPIIYDHAAQSYKLTNSSWSMPNVHLTLMELQVLAVAIQSLVPTVPTPFSNRLQDLFAKLLDALPEENRQQIRQTQEQVVFVPVPVQSKGHEWIESLLQAIRNKLTVQMTYYVMSREEESQRRIDPYHLRCYEGTWYVVGYDHLTGHWPIFNLARIRKLTVTEDPYRIRQFDASQYFKHSFGITVGGEPHPVRIKLTGWAAKTASEKLWPAGFTLEITSKDEAILTGQLANHGDLLPWIAAYQGDAEILPPLS